MNAATQEQLDSERAREEVLALRGELEAHRSVPADTQEWKDQEKSLLERLSAAEGEVAKLTAAQGIIDA